MLFLVSRKKEIIWDKGVNMSNWGCHIVTVTSSVRKKVRSMNFWFWQRGIQTTDWKLLYCPWCLTCISSDLRVSNTANWISNLLVLKLPRYWTRKVTTSLFLGRFSAYKKTTFTRKYTQFKCRNNHKSYLKTSFLSLFLLRMCCLPFRMGKLHYVL